MDSGSIELTYSSPGCSSILNWDSSAAIIKVAVDPLPYSDDLYRIIPRTGLPFTIMDRMANFASNKLSVLAKADLSRKGSVDEPIRDLIHFINSQECFYTTSSCSGRLAVFSEVCMMMSPWLQK